MAANIIHWRGELEPESRLALFKELADYFRALVEYPAEVVEQLSDEQYVRDVVEVLFAPASYGNRTSSKIGLR
jgi:hypothetical protein